MSSRLTPDRLNHVSRIQKSNAGHRRKTPSKVEVLARLAGKRELGAQMDAIHKQTASDRTSESSASRLRYALRFPHNPDSVSLDARAAEILLHRTEASPSAR